MSYWSAAAFFLLLDVQIVYQGHMVQLLPDALGYWLLLAGCRKFERHYEAICDLVLPAAGLGIALRFLAPDPPVEKPLVMACRDRVLGPQAQTFLHFFQP